MVRIFRYEATFNLKGGVSQSMLGATFLWLMVVEWKFYGRAYKVTVRVIQNGQNAISVKLAH
jgi:hypothetical protein